MILFLVNIRLKGCLIVVSEERFMLKYCPDKYKGKETCGNAVDDVLVFANGDIFFYDVDCNNITFPNNDVVLSNIDLININLDDDIFDEDDPETIDHVRLMTWRNRFKQCKACKKEIMPLAWHPIRWWNWCA